MSIFLLYIVVVLLLSSVAVVVMLWLRKRIGGETLRRNHEVAGFVYSVVGAIFAVTVALMVTTFCPIETSALSTVFSDITDWKSL